LLIPFPSGALDANTTKAIRNLGDERTSRLPSRLYLYPNMPIMVTFNQAVELGIANGQLGRVVKWQFPSDVTWTNEADPYLNGASVRVRSISSFFTLLDD